MADVATSPSDEAPSAPLPEFRIVVRQPGGRGPLGPYRLTLAVVVVLAIFGPGLWNMVSSTTPDDGLVLRAGLAGLLVWVTSGVVDRALGAADSAPRRHTTPT